MKDPESAPFLASLAGKNFDPRTGNLFLAEASLEALGQIGSPVAESALLTAFASLREYWEYDGWFSDPNANGHVALWGLLLAAVGVVSYLVSKKAKRDWVGLTVGIVPFVIVLYFFFQNVNRLLPPNL